MTMTDTNPEVSVRASHDQLEKMRLIGSQWAGLSHIPGVVDGSLPGVPRFVDHRDRHRLSAYIALRAIIESNRRLLLVDDSKTEYREFGDAGMLLDRISSAIVGENPRISVKGADRSMPAYPEIPPPPPEPAAADPDMPELDAEIRDFIYQTAKADWLAQAKQIAQEWAENLALQPKLEARQKWLREWGDPSQADFLGRVVEAENEYIVPLGDGVYTLGWNAHSKRVDIDVLEPDVYFPDLAGDDGINDFPSVVHLCWPETRYERNTEGRLAAVDYVERITYELIPIDPDDPDHDPSLDYSHLPRYPVGERGPTHLCFMSHGVWKAEDFDSVYETPTEPPARWVSIPDPTQDFGFVEANRVSIGYDFIPVVHVANTLSRSAHFGRSPLTRVAQLADELAKADTGRALAAAWAADPLTVFKGLQPGQYDTDKKLVIRPPAGFAAESDGGIETVDMAAQLDGLGRYVDSLIDRFSTNLAVPKGLIGRIEAAEIPSGVALALLFTALDQLVMQSHMAREPKYPLVLKMKQRIALHWGDPHMLEDPTIYPAFIEWGPYMPTDLTALANVIKMLRDAKAVSASACITALQAAGFITGDHAVELAALMEENADLIEAYADSLGPKFAARIAGVPDWEPDDSVDDLGAVSPLAPAPEPEPGTGPSET